MKIKLSLFLFLLMYTSFVISQDTSSTLIDNSSKYKIVIGGDLSFLNYKQTQEIEGFSGNKIKYDRRTLFYRINPSIGYNITERLMVGLGFGYSYNRINSNVIHASNVIEVIPYTLVSGDYSGKVFARYVFNPKNKLKFNLKAEAGVLKAKREIFDGIDNDLIIENNTTFETAIVVGFLYRINPRYNFLVNIGELNYISSKIERGAEFNSLDIIDLHNSNFSFDFSLSSIRFGLERNF